MPNLQEMTLTDLRQLAKTFNIKNISKLKKEELIEILTQIFKEEQKKQEANNKEQIRTEKTSMAIMAYRRTALMPALFFLP